MDKQPFYTDLPLEEMERQMNEDGHKAVFWYNKKMGGEDAEERMMQELSEKAHEEDRMCATGPIVEYTTQEGRQWMVWNTRYVYSAGGHDWFRDLPHITPYYRDENDGLFFVKSLYINQDGTTKFGQFDGSELRCHIKCWPDVTFCHCMQCIKRAENQGIDTESGEDINSLKSIQCLLSDDFDWSIHIDGDKAYAVVHSGWMNGDVERREGTYILLNMREHHEGWESLPDFLVPAKNRLEEQIRRFFRAKDGYDEYKDPLEEAKDMVFVSDGASNEDEVNGTIRISQFYAFMYKMHNDIFGVFPAKIDMTKATTGVLGILNAMTKFVNEKAENDFSSLQVKLSIILFLLHNELGDGLKKYTQDDVASKLQRNIPRYIEELKQIRQTVNERLMQEKMQSELIKVLKSEGIKSEFEKMATSLNVPNIHAYYQRTEGIYAISRLIPLLPKEKHQGKFERANRKWMDVVVGMDLCQQLRKYYDKFGKDRVLQAIYYLMDHSAWQSPIGVEGLSNKDRVNGYAGLDDLDETIQLIIDEEEYRKGQEGEQPATVPTTVPDGSPSGEEQGAKQPGTFKLDMEALSHNELGNARQSYRIALRAIEDARQRLEDMANVCLNDELLTMLEEENGKLEARVKELQEKVSSHERVVEELCKNHIKEVEDLCNDNDKKLDAMQARVTAAKNEAKHAKEEAERFKNTSYQNRKDKDEAERNLQALQATHQRTVNELEELRKAAKEATTPSVRFLSKEKLSQLYGMGEKMQSILIPFLEKEVGVLVLDAQQMKNIKRKK